MLISILPRSHGASDSAPKRTNAKIAVKNTSRVSLYFRIVQLKSSISQIDVSRPGKFYTVRPGVTVLLENMLKEIGEFHYICVEYINKSDQGATLEFTPDSQMQYGETYVQGSLCPRMNWDGQ